MASRLNYSVNHDSVSQTLLRTVSHLSTSRLSLGLYAGERQPDVTSWQCRDNLDWILDILLLWTMVGQTRLAQFFYSVLQISTL